MKRLSYKVRGSRGQLRSAKQHGLRHERSQITVALAQEVDADLLILDDEEARDTALLEGLSVVGLLAFLVRAKAWGIVREVRPLLDALKRQDFFISDELYQHVLRMAGEL